MEILDDNIHIIFQQIIQQLYDKIYTNFIKKVKIELKEFLLMVDDMH